jgi:endonuclease III
MTKGGADFAPDWEPDGGDRRRNQSRVGQLSRSLVNSQGTSDLGNHADPLDEAIYIQLTYQTDFPRVRQVFHTIKRRFLTWDALMAAEPAEVALLLQPAGFQRSRCRLTRQLLDSVRARFGGYTLAPRRGGYCRPKPRRYSASCPALTGREPAAWPCTPSVAKPSWSIQTPSGSWGGTTCSPYPRSAAAAKSIVISGSSLPQSIDIPLHVNSVAHDQTFCLPRTPRRSECPLRRTCPIERSAAT